MKKRLLLDDGPVVGCNSTAPLKHPWLPIADTACGYEFRLVAPECEGCIRRREESALDQLRALDARHTENGIGDKPNIA